MKNLKIDLDEDEGKAPVNATSDETIVVEDTGSKADIVDEDAGDTDKLPEHAIVNDNGTITLPLFKPVTITTKKDGKIREREFAVLTFHRLTGADMQAIAVAPKEKETAVVFARSTKTMQALMDAIFAKLDMVDIADGGRVLNHFLTSGRKTGRSSSAG